MQTKFKILSMMVVTVGLIGIYSNAANPLGELSTDHITVDGPDADLYFSISSLNDPCSHPLFSNPRFDAGGALSSIALADFDGDIIVDMVIANQFQNTVSLLRNLGNGTFGPAVSFAVGQSPTAVVAIDVNIDGRPDLAVTNRDSDSVSILMNIGNGFFTEQVTYAAGDGPWALAVGEFNGDPFPDLVVANSQSEDVSILLNTGFISFQLAHTYPASDKPTTVTTGDMNGDGFQDINGFRMAGYKDLDLIERWRRIVPASYCALDSWYAMGCCAGRF